MSKAQKGNKENKKPKADKNQPRATISAYRSAQGQGKPASSPFARKKILTPLQRGPRDDGPDDPVSRDYEVVRSLRSRQPAH